MLSAVVSADWEPRVRDADVAVLLLHGYGADERDLIGLIEPLGITAPWASLRAPLPTPGTGGAAWFPIERLETLPLRAVESATSLIWSWVEAAIPPTTRVLPIGFSQGGLMATQLLRTRPERVVAPVVLAGFVLDAPQPADAALLASRPAAFWGRGDSDQVIPAQAVAATAAFLPQHTRLTERLYPGLGHAISMTELVDVAAFIRGEAVGAVLGEPPR